MIINLGFDIETPDYIVKMDGSLNSMNDNFNDLINIKLSYLKDKKITTNQIRSVLEICENMKCEIVNSNDVDVTLFE